MLNKDNRDTLDSGIDVGQEINVGPGKFSRKNNRKAWKLWQKLRSL